MKQEDSSDTGRDDHQEIKEEVTTFDGRYLRFNKAAVAYHSSVHIIAAYGLYLCLTSAMWKTIIFAFVMQRLNMLAISGGVHRLWCHRTYKAKLPVRIFYMIFYMTVYQFSIKHWVRDHRVHHKYSETDADPHNTNRGLFFAHIGWLLRERHPENLKKIHSVDLTDMMADPVIRFNEKYRIYMAILLTFFLPTVIPMYYWNETFVNSFCVNILRYILTLNEEFCVNSAAHAWGYRPYDSNIKPVESKFLQIIGTGEGFHNYHHTFPFDYAISEYGTKYNFCTAFIDLMAWFGLAYDLKTATKTMVEARKRRNQMQNSAKGSTLDSIPGDLSVREGA